MSHETVPPGGARAGGVAPAVTVTAPAATLYVGKPVVLREDVDEAVFRKARQLLLAEDAMRTVVEAGQQLLAEGVPSSRPMQGVTEAGLAATFARPFTSNRYGTAGETDRLPTVDYKPSGRAGELFDVVLARRHKLHAHNDQSHGAVDVTDLSRWPIPGTENTLSLAVYDAGIGWLLEADMLQRLVELAADLRARIRGELDDLEAAHGPAHT